MKTIIKVIVIVIVASILLAAISKFPSFDEIGDKFDDLKTNIKDLISDEDDQKFEEKTLYITSGQDVKTYKNISNLSDGQRGFFVKDNTVFYFIKSSGHPDMGTRIDPDTLTYGGYEYVFYTTTDMVTFVNYTDQFAAVFDDERLVVYLVVDGIDYDEAVELSDELLANQDIEFIHNDPPVIEVPGAE